MIAFACLVLAIVVGCAAMARLYGRLLDVDRAPRWAAILFASGAGTLFGLAATSILYFLVILLLPRFALADPIIEIASLASLIYWIARRPRPESKPGHEKNAWNLAIAGALLLALILATGAMSKSWDLNSQGGWDAWTIWNLRAKFLAAPNVAAPDIAGQNLAARAWSPLLASTHPEYPLLLSAAIARCWRFSGATADSVPIAIAYIFFLALVATVTGGIAIVRGRAAGLIAGLTLASSAALLHEVPAQYADIPIAAYMSCAALFVLLNRPVWAGIFAGFAVWTKDEGALFCVVLLALLAIFRWRDALNTIMGLLPGAMIVAAFKAFLAPHVTAQFGAGTFARLADGGRWGVVLGGMISQIILFGGGSFHPVFVPIAYAIGVRFRVDSRRDAWMFTALAVMILAGYCIVMVASPNDVLWQTNTAAGRLVVQWWPLAVIAVMVWLRPAEELVIAETPAKKKRR